MYGYLESQVKSIKDNEDTVERDPDQCNAAEFGKGLEAVSMTVIRI